MSDGAGRKKQLSPEETELAISYDNVFGANHERTAVTGRGVHIDGETARPSLDELLHRQFIEAQPEEKSPLGT